MKRDEFIATIGYQGETAIIDKNILTAIKGLSAEELLEKGLLKAAFCAALYEDGENGDTTKENMVLEFFNGISSTPVESVDALKRIFGVYNVPDLIQKVTQI